MIEIVLHRPQRFACFSVPLNTGEAMAYLYNMKSVFSTMKENTKIFTLFSKIDHITHVFHNY